jgi:outer membrane protein OmpA-like peptidoglycan-associated protein
MSSTSKPIAYKFEPCVPARSRSARRKLKAAPHLHLVIQAWTDPYGASDYNLALSKKRAETCQVPSRAGVPPDTQLVYHGERRPRDANPRLAGADRRVELQYRVP